MKKILCIGHASYDVTLPLNYFPIENTKNRITEKTECGGGPASNVAYLLGKWGLNPTFVGIVGNDIYGKRVIKEMEIANVETKYIEEDENYETTLSFIIVNKSIGTRTTLTHRNLNMKLKKTYNLKADLILVDGQELETSIKAIKDNPNAVTVIDAGNLKKETLILSKMVDYLVCSRKFAEEFTNIKVDINKKENIKEIFVKMEKTFKNQIIITIGSKGCLYKLGNKIKLMPSLKVASIDSTGAGDFFHGAFMYALYNNYDLEEALKLSTITGALSVTRLGGRNSVHSNEEVLKIYNDVS